MGLWGVDAGLDFITPVIIGLGPVYTASRTQAEKYTETYTVGVLTIRGATTVSKLGGSNSLV